MDMSNGKQHEGHDPSDPTMDMEMTMSMFFHTGKKETVLFEFWKTEKTGAFIGSLVIIFLMAFSYEALKYWRDRMFTHQAERTRSALNVSRQNSIVSQMLGSFHLMQTLLHMVQFVLSYFLMLIFMTYNVWLAIAVTLGAGMGYFCFGWKKSSAVDITEHCQ